jgi:demethylmacrocin O-methyltransferase
MTLLNKIRLWAKDSLSEEQQAKIKKYVRPILAGFFRHDLNKLATIWGTDKWNSHWYTQHFQHHFNAWRHRPINLLEIGVGGYEDPELGGNSLFMWKSFFTKANIFSVDIYNKQALEQKRLKIFQGSQIDAEFLNQVVKAAGGFDIIIDDGSHLNEHVIKSFEILFPLLNNDGWYVVEDMQTAYWPDFGGDSQDLDKPQTSVNYFKQLVHCLNHQELVRPDYRPTYFDRHITEIHFYHNMVFIKKGDNNEGSNLVLDNKLEKTNDIF